MSYTSFFYLYIRNEDEMLSKNDYFNILRIKDGDFK